MTPSGHPGGEQGLDDASAQAGDCSAGLSTTPLPVARPAATIPGDREREVPRADHGDDAARGVAERVALAGQLDEPLRPSSAIACARSTRGSRSPRTRRRRPPPTASRTRGRPARRAWAGGGAAHRRRARGSRRAGAAILPRGCRGACGADRGIDVGGGRRRRQRDDPVGGARVRRFERGGVAAVAADDHRHAQRELGVERREGVHQRLADGGAAQLEQGSLMKFMGRRGVGRGHRRGNGSEEGIVGGVLEQPAHEVAHAGDEISTGQYVRTRRSMPASACWRSSPRPRRTWNSMSLWFFRAWASAWAIERTLCDAIAGRTSCCFRDSGGG